MSDEMDSLLDETLDDLADLPSFKPFVAGAHRVLATLEAKEVSNTLAIELSFKYLAIEELADQNLPEEDQPKEGDTASTLFFLNNDIGQGKFKIMGGIFAEALGCVGATKREIIEAVTDIECIIISSITVDKNDPDKLYLDLKELQVV